MAHPTRSSQIPKDVGELLAPTDAFAPRHIGVDAAELREMLATLGLGSLEELIDQTIPAGIRRQPLRLPPPKGEQELLDELRAVAQRNDVYRSFIGMGYHGCILPAVIQRNVLENPCWYTAYTPYQAEIAQGRLEALLNFQTLVADLTGLPLANASLLDEATAAAEAMTMCRALAKGGRDGFHVAEDCHPQTLAVVRTRAQPLGIRVQVGPAQDADCEAQRLFWVLVQYPTTDGCIRDYAGLAERSHAAGALLVAAVDPLALTLLRPPGEFGADIAVGSAQRLGVPMGFGGPHAAFLSTRDEYKRLVPGRIIGISRDAEGRPAFRMALQTREQHIRREKATSNITTNQTLLALAGLVHLSWLGPQGLREQGETCMALGEYAKERLGLPLAFPEQTTFKEFAVRVGRSAKDVIHDARARGVHPGYALGRDYEGLDDALLVAVTEKRTPGDIDRLAEVLGEVAR
jgi:glycine dehydrogenase